MFVDQRDADVDERKQREEAVDPVRPLEQHEERHERDRDGREHDVDDPLRESERSPGGTSELWGI